MKKKVTRAVRPNVLPCGCRIYANKDGKISNWSGHVVLTDAFNALCRHGKAWRLVIRWEERGRKG